MDFTVAAMVCAVMLCDNTILSHPSSFFFNTSSGVNYQLTTTLTPSDIALLSLLPHTNAFCILCTYFFAKVLSAVASPQRASASLIR